MRGCRPRIAFTKGFRFEQDCDQRLGAVAPTRYTRVRDWRIGQDLARDYALDIKNNPNNGVDFTVAEPERLCLTSRISTLLDLGSRFITKLELDSRVEMPVLLFSVVMQRLDLTSRLNLEELDR